MKTVAITIIIITLLTGCTSTRIGLHSDGKHIDYNIHMNIRSR